MTAPLCTYRFAAPLLSGRTVPAAARCGLRAALFYALEAAWSDSPTPSSAPGARGTG